MEYKFTNDLIHETSPYLLQHAHNPVNWHAWNETTLAKAKQEDKLILISIGYSACHWCHVMEHESFEDEDIAELMNKHFINIKIDREERPDLDHLYMQSVQLITGRGGWPLNCFALPDGKPIYGGTYFRKNQWNDVLIQMAEFYKREKDKCIEYASELAMGVSKIEQVIKVNAPHEFNAKDIDACYQKFEKQFDNLEGGANRAPKFPMPVNYSFLLRHSSISHNETCKKHVILTLKKMAYGGIYDQLGGGFARYSTDMIWKVPHFEKMLYDNAQLISLYSEAYQYTKEPLYKDVVFETISFLNEELKSDDGSFYAALDADSEGIEGKFYTWTKSELSEILKGDADLFCDYFNVTENGNWEHGQNILLRDSDDFEIANRFGLSLDELKKKLTDLKSRLIKVRNKRIRPGLDDKQITSWNGLVLKALADAYRVFDKNQFADDAIVLAEFIQSKILQPDGSLKHCYKNGLATITGFAEDYCFVIEGLICLYQATGDESRLQFAFQLMNYCLAHFYDSSTGMFYFSSNGGEKLFANSIETQDNVIPSSNSSLAKSLFLLSRYFSNSQFEDISKQMLLNVKSELLSFPSAYANWAQLLQHFSYDVYEVCITGSTAHDQLKEINKTYIPNLILCSASEASSIPLLQDRFVKNKTLIYACINGSCMLPVENAAQAIAQLLYIQ